jgi:tetratricopeptide (TPR) repeat protein
MTQVTSNSSNALWGKVLRHFELSEGFAFVLLTVADNFTANQYANELEVMLRSRSQKLERLEYNTPESAMEIANVVLNRTPEQHPAIAALWIQALTTASDPTMPAWKTTWQRIGARLNERRDVIRTLRFTLVLVCPEACMPAFREAAPDLWSVRAMTGNLQVLPPSNDGNESAVSLDAIEGTKEQFSDPNLAMRAAEQARQKRGGEPELVMFLIRASQGYAAKGDFQTALLPALESTKIARKLAKDKPKAFRPNLARSLNNLGNRLSDLGRHREAVTVTQEAVNIWRAFARDNPQMFKSDLAFSLNSLGVRLNSIGKHEETFTVTQEAVAIRRELTRDNPQRFKPVLALSLSNLGNSYNELGRLEEALTVSQEATGIYRELARDKPQESKPGLAMSLNNLGIRFSTLGRLEEALTVSQEAFDLRRDLARDNPAVFNPDLAGSLNNLGHCFKANGQLDKAHVSYEEAARILAPHFFSLPEAFVGQMTFTIRSYLQSCQALNLDPDAQLVDPIIQKLNELA